LFLVDLPSDSSSDPLPLEYSRLFPTVAYAVSNTSGRVPGSSYPWRYKTLNLRTPNGWNKLRKLLSGDRDIFKGRAIHPAAQRIIELLRAHKVASAVVEFPYHDRDFAEEYLAFHARQFRPGRKACMRIHFFAEPSENLDHIIGMKVRDEHKRAGQLKGLAGYTLAGGAYRGFCVCRPTRDVPLGFTVIARPATRYEIDRKLWTKYTTHILGQEFHAFGFPFIEQDSRTGACAQAALWMALRFIWAAEGGPWRSVPLINSAATADPDVTNSLSVPAGSGGLHPSSLMRAVRNAERIPHYFSGVPALQNGRFTYKWKKDHDPIALACRYIDSDIPVVLLVGHTSDRSIPISVAQAAESPAYEVLDIPDAHALTVVGYYGELKKPAVKLRGIDHHHVAEWVDGLLVHNDQAGPYVQLPRATQADGEQPCDSGSVSNSSEFTSADIIGIIVPLPDEVFLRADKAEEYAWMLVTEKVDEWLRNHLGARSANGATRKRSKRLDPNRLVARTFLARGYNHYQWLSKVNAHSNVLTLAAALHHPRYVWITEFYTLDKNDVPDLDYTIAHVVADATAVSESVGKRPYNSFMFGHVQGYAFAVMTTGKPGGAKFAVRRVPHDHPYQSYERKDGHRVRA
jgi:hypothetical protein